MNIIALAQMQKERLLAREPRLAGFFRDVRVPSLEATVPFLPIRAFRQFAIDSGAPGHRTTFVSSGSTNAQRASHGFGKAALNGYARGSVQGFGAFLSRFGFSTDTPLLSLVPPPEVWPSSSLAAMIAMFRDAGFDVKYCHPDADPEALFDALAPLDSAIVFGTSFHHVWMSRVAAERKTSFRFPGRRLMVIDTGGTKGRTELFTQEEISTLIRATYGSPRELFFTSEYGMCELASQAWSAESPHDGTFVCNRSLGVLAIAPDGRTSVGPDEVGFLAFLDGNNVDSHSCIITEDLGMTPAFDRFRLLGRAPDATIKGCSLNVRDDFLATQRPRGPHSRHRSPVTGSQASAFDGGLPERLLGRLPHPIWPSPLREELAGALGGWEGAPMLAERFACPNPGAILEIVASANIPITWLFPAAAARLLGYGEVILTLPTLRADDPLSAPVLARIRSLAEALTPELAPMALTLREKGSLGEGPATSDTLLVFGSDTTCDTFSRRYRSQVASLLTFGDVWNSASITTRQASEASEMVSSWQGRGCLTPLVLFLEDAPPAGAPEDFLNDFSRLFESRMRSAREGADAALRFAHRHDIWEIEGRIGLENLHFGSNTSVVDLTPLPAAKLEKLDLPWRAAGAGLVFLLGPRRNYPWLTWLRTENVFPGILDSHQGKTWIEWLSGTYTAEGS